MFDPKSEPHEFVGADRAEAVEAACRFFGAEESDLTIAELAQEEVSGLGNRVLIVAVPQGAPRPTRGGPEEEDRGRGGRDRGRDRGDRGGRDRGERGGRGGRGGRDRDRGRDRGGRGREDRGERSRDDRGERSRDDRGERSRDDRGDGGREDRDQERAARAEAPAAAPVDEPSEATVEGDLSDLGEFVKGVVERMKLGRFEISQAEEDDLVVIRVTGSAAMRLTTAETRVADAIQLLANQVSIKGGRNGPRVVVDVEGDRTKREAYLEQLASRACDRAESTGRAVALDPMNGKDRRAIHVALRGVEGIATMSIGEGQYRQVVVVPEGAPEYEDARRKSDEAAQAQDD